MKKNISINISGIIFHIEEDGYESLRKYMDSITRYFSSFDDSSEIMADIESRIAEIFLSKLNEGKQVITSEDVNSLISTMGSVSDFKAAEEQEPVTAEQSASSSKEENKSGQKSFNASKQLLRDQKRKILGGVCAGLGSYLNVDPVWIRLLFAILTFAYGITLLAYIIMWIVVPGSYELEEPEVTKKLFRDPERKVISGVSGGVASFLGIDIIAVRVLFIVFTMAGGIGLLIYIVLWAILPEAKSLTDKMQMQGEAVTLSNIESNIKKNQNLTGSDEETTFTKILLFPFRLIGMLITVLGKVLMPVIEVLRVAIGILVTFLGLVLVFAIIVGFGALVGIFTRTSFGMGGEMTDFGFPVDIFSNTFPPLTVLATFVIAVIPGIFIMLLGISTIAKRIVFGNAVGWTLFVFFFASVVVAGLTVPRIAYAFKEEGEYKIENTYEPTGKRLLLKMNERGLDHYNVTRLTLKGYDGKNVKLVQSFESQGSTRLNAIENAKMVEYNVAFKDSILTFDNNLQFKKDAKFRAQRLNLTLYIPYDMPYVMDKDVNRFVTNYFSNDDLNDDHSWKMTMKGHVCLTCPDKTENEEGDRSDLTDFNEIDVNGVADIEITQGDHYSIDFAGDDDDKERYDLHKEGKTLVIEFADNGKNFWKNHIGSKDVKINIVMPELQKLEAKGAGKIKFHEFSTNEMQLEVLGAVDVKGQLHVQNLNVNISGASSVDLQGDAKNMEATIQGASSLNAYLLEVTDAIVEANGASNAKVNVTGTLDMEKGIASDIHYHGNPKITEHK
jgi:phage shock protein PspC (stress-responsive transcriptional regulator)